MIHQKPAREAVKETAFPTFLCEYPFEGTTWCFEIKAKDRVDAEARLRAMPFAKLLGECTVKIKVPFGGFFERFFRRG